MNQWAEQEGFDYHQVWQQCEHLCTEEMVTKNRADISRYGITPLGILYAEQHGYLAKELIQHNREVRMRILEIFLQRYEEYGSAVIDPQVFTSIEHVGRDDFYRNIGVLVEQGYVYYSYNVIMRYGVTSEGRRIARASRIKRNCLLEFERLTVADGISPQKRGIELERIVGKAIEAEGWTCEPDIHGEGEQHDLLVYRGREYYIVECKWHKNKVETRYIREFYARITERVGVHGIFVSMSDYAENAIKNAEYRFDSRMVILFNPLDIESIMRRQTTFSELLDSKIKEIVSKRKSLRDIP